MRNAGDRDWAYITFASNKDACIALTMQPNEKNPLVTKILPAFTWKQPPVQESTNTSTSRNSNELSLLMLNDDCLREIFRYCDLHTQAIAWKVCQKMRNILEEYVLRKTDEYTIDFLNGKPNKRLKRVHDELQCVGPYVKRLCLSETFVPCTEYFEKWRTFKFYLQHCSKYVGASIKELRIDIPADELLNGNFEILQPLLLQVESLYVFFDDDAAYGHQFDIHAPKLKSLILDIDQEYHDGSAKEITFLEFRCPCMEKLIVRITPKINLIAEFLRNNPKLKYLQVMSDNYRALSTVVASVSCHLEELVVYGVLFGTNYEGIAFWPLENCRSLEKIVLHECESQDLDVNPIMEILYKNLKKLKSLRSIMVTACSSYDSYLPKNSELFANFGREIPHLEHFYTDFMLEQSTIIEFIKTSPNLKTFFVALFEKVCPMNIGFLKTLADARKSLFETGCGKIFVLDLVFFPPRKRTAHQTVSDSIANVTRVDNQRFSF